LTKQEEELSVGLRCQRKQLPISPTAPWGFPGSVYSILFNTVIIEGHWSMNSDLPCLLMKIMFTNFRFFFHWHT